MNALLRVSAIIDRVNTFIGRAVGWLILASILISAINATVRKIFDVSSNAWLEAQWQLYGAAFLLAASYTFLRNEHIRIDIVSNALPRQLRNSIDLLGHVVMLLPFTSLVIWEAWPWWQRSYILKEMSNNFGGLILWPIKGIIIVAFALLFIQGISEIIKRIAIMMGRIEDPFAHKGHHAPPVEEMSV